MVEIAGYRVGDVTLTRVPYFDVALDPGVVNLTADEVASAEWGVPTWADGAGQVLVGLAVWVIESEGQTIVVDPCGAADQFLRSGPEAITHQEAVFAAMTSAGFEPGRVDVVLLSHLDGIGMAAAVDAGGAWTPAFRDARVVMSAPELEFLRGCEPAAVSGLDALRALIERGVVDGVPGGHWLTDAVALEVTAGHTPGHALVQIRSEGEAATFVGHLALTPLHAAVGDPSRRHRDPATADAAFRALLADAKGDDRLLIGALWPFPGAGYAVDDRIEPAAD